MHCFKLLGDRLPVDERSARKCHQPGQVKKRSAGSASCVDVSAEIRHLALGVITSQIHIFALMVIDAQARLADCEISKFPYIARANAIAAKGLSAVIYCFEKPAPGSSFHLTKTQYWCIILSNRQSPLHGERHSPL